MSAGRSATAVRYLWAPMSPLAIRPLLLLCAVAGCTPLSAAPELACPPRTLPTVRVTRLPEVVVRRNVDLVNATNRGRLAVLRTLFEGFGCEGPSLVEKPAHPFRQPNLSCTLPGERADRIVVGARFNKPTDGSDWVDDWSGASLLPALRLSLGQQPRHHTFEFVAFSSDERGPVGARSFVSALGDDELRRIRAMVHIDGIGTGALRAELGHSDPELLCDFWSTAALLEVPPEARILASRVRSEEEPFRRAGVPVIDLSSLTGRDAAIARAQRDAAPALDDAAYYESYRLLAVYLAILDERLAAGGAPR